MHMDDDGVTDPTTEFEELFEGQVAFESELGDHDADEMLGSIGNDMAIGASSHHHRSSHHPSDQDILDANLPFVPDDYLQHQHMVLDSESSEFMGPMSNLGGLEDGQNTLQGLGDGSGAEAFMQPNSGSQVQSQGSQISMNAGAASITVASVPQSFNQGTGLASNQMAVPSDSPSVMEEGPKVKNKVKVVKDVEFFTNENLERYFKRRGFKTKKGADIATKTVSRAVFALSSNTQSSHYHKLVSFGSSYEPEHVIQEMESLFTGRFKIRAKETKELMESFDWEKMLDSDNDSDELDDCNEGSNDDAERSDLEANTAQETYVHSVINEVRNSARTNLPSISIYTTSDDPVCGAISKHGSLVAFGQSEAGIRLYPLEKAKDLFSNYVDKEHLIDPEGSYGLKTFCGHAGTVYGVNFHPRTMLLFSVGQDSFMRVWDLNSKETSGCRAVYRGHSGPIWALDIPNSGAMVATAGLDTTARIFLPERTEFVRMMAGHYFSVNMVKFHPNEAYIATGSDDKSSRLWSVHDGQMVRMFTGASGSINCLAFHSSGKYLAGAGEDNKILIWDLAEGEVIATLDCVYNCKDLIFSGNMLTACFRNGMLQIFNLRPIVGGEVRESFYDKFSSDSSISSPYTTNTAARTLFKVYYKNPGTLYCLGSTATVPADCLPSREERTRRTSKGKASGKTSKPQDNAPNGHLNSRNNLLHHAIQAKSNINISSLAPVSESNAIKSDAAVATTNPINTSKKLAARLSQPLPHSSSSISSGIEEGEISNMILSEGDDPSSVDTSSVSAPASSAPMISSSELDAAIASVIDQSGGDHSTGSGSGGGVGGGTVTMYASN